MVRNLTCGRRKKTQKLSSIWALRSSHSTLVIPRPVAILRSLQKRYDKRETLRGELRMHDYEAKSLHFVYPGLVLLPKIGNGRPLVLSPE